MTGMIPTPDAPARGTAARPSPAAETAANLVRVAVPPAGVVSALGLAGAAVVVDSVWLGVAGALAGCLGAGAAWWQSHTVEGRFRTERLRNRESHRRLQLTIEDLRRRHPGAVTTLPTAAAPAASAAPAVEPEGDAEVGAVVVVPDTVPAVMPARRPEGAPEISMELPALEHKELAAPATAD